MPGQVRGRAGGLWQFGPLERARAAIAHEHNYVLNTQHPDFASIRIAGREEFAFDPRIKAQEPE